MAEVAGLAPPGSFEGAKAHDPLGKRCKKGLLRMKEEEGDRRVEMVKGKRVARE
jgi:hypothetical protein